MAHDAPTALETARDRAPEVALVDIGLPVIDGYELAARLHELPGLAATPVVAVTGYGQASDRERTRIAGFAQHLVKPIGLDDLRALFATMAASAACLPSS